MHRQMLRDGCGLRSTPFGARVPVQCQMAGLVSCSLEPRPSHPARCSFYNFKCQTGRPAKVVVSPHASFRTGPDWYGKVRMWFLGLNLIFVVSPRPNTQKRAQEKYGKSTEKYGKVRKPIVSSRRNGRTGTDWYGRVRNWFFTVKMDSCCFA